LTGVGVVSTVAVSCSPPTINFAGIQLHTTSVQGPITCVITNGPALSMSVSIGTATAGQTGDFGIASTTCTGSVSGSCGITPQFSPKIYGAASVPVTVSWTGGSTTLTLSGGGVNSQRGAPF
jgi:hypothetical protein